MKKTLLKKSQVFLVIISFFIISIIIPVNGNEIIKKNEINSLEKGGSPPTVLEFDGPSSVNINDTVVFYLKAHDPNGHQIRYLIDWKNYHEEEDFEIQEITSYMGSNQTIQISHKFTIGGTYDLAVIAENVNGDQSEIFIHDFNVNGGKANINSTMWTEPDRFTPNQEVVVFLKMTNIGNRDSNTIGILWSFDGSIYWNRPIIYFIKRIEVGNSYIGDREKRWPNDYDNHTIGLWSNVYLIKSAKQNLPPYKPDAPIGTRAGLPNREYFYTAITTDPCEHDLYYLFDWGDGQYSTWLGPNKSGESIEKSHKWYEGTYQIKVKAKDEHGLETDWSEPLEIYITRSKSYNKPIFNINENILRAFPLIAKILDLFNI